MRGWLSLLAALALCALGGNAATAQTPLDCSMVPQSVCENEDLLGLEGERSALIEQLTALDPQHAALSGEQTWIDGLAACGEDVECHRTAYIDHNKMLRESISGLARAEAEPPLGEPPDAGTIEAPPIGSEEVAPAPRRDDAREQPIYAPRALPGWGFFTAIGLALLGFWALLRRLGEHRRELREEEARLRDEWG